MSYTPTTWATGDTVTAALLNKLEQGIANAGGVLVCGPNPNNPNALNKTWQEISNAILSGVIPVLTYDNEDGSGGLELIQSTGIDNGSYLVFLLSNPNDPSLSATSSAGYPTWL